MRIENLFIKNFRGIAECKVELNQGFNVLIGSNSSGKTSVIKALNWLLNPFMQPIINNSIPYGIQATSENSIIVEADFSFDAEDYVEMKSMLANNKSISAALPAKIPDELRFKYTKYGTVRKGNIANIQQNMVFSDLSNTAYQHLIGWAAQKAQSSTLIYFHGFEQSWDVNGFQNFIPTSQVNSININQPNQLILYIKSIILKLKDEEPENFNSFKEKILSSQSLIKEFDADFNIRTGRAEIWVKYSESDFKRPLENEGLGFQEYIYLLVLILLYPNKLIVMDEGLVHMHRELLRNFITSITDTNFQILMTSHVRELVQILDYSNLIYCSNKNGKIEVQNFSSIDDLKAVYTELGYLDESNLA
ncbi:DUF2813 domain-containing protein [Leptospira congkakensis]|uniref:DUF2813 domain-containing protein n=1 Tax=Leptospira congkakensis TaxID=2484932 RepID=A0A4Z1ADD3_9LEPT|nr:AAA family ATPase [Leptospira congkakensis]TGL87400.1 DUF2813 domain-containing protein [Leptospira congkakensis]TGL92969.1 DUF2813 domain-containing protein [Leptospira congkakensis]TGL93248.1 DUF2813 domain-containing protein [Leptospira congkakensis]